MKIIRWLFDKSPQKIKRVSIKAVYLKKLLTLKGPRIIFIEPTNYCNYKCTICPITSMKRKKGFMNLDLFKKIVDEASNIGIKRINLQMYGEPLLHPKLLEMIRYAKSKKSFEVWFDTNVYLLDEKKNKRNN